MSKPVMNPVKELLETAYDTVLKVETELVDLYNSLNELENHLVETKKLIHRAEQLCEDDG